MNSELLDLFKVLVVETTGGGNVCLDNVAHGFVTDFVPTASQRAILREKFQPINIKTLFTVEERQNADPFELITKQVLHYIEVYGLHSPGLFNLEVDGGKVVTLAFVRGVTVPVLGDLVRDLLYANAPAKDAAVLKNIIDDYGIAFDINAIKNNELRVLLYDDSQTFQDGDDAVRYICYKATGKSMLIKSPEVVAAVGQNPVSRDFLRKHEDVLAKVFNRHKPILMALKSKATKSAINRISRFSKTLHVPLYQSVAKGYLAAALNGKPPPVHMLSLRDKFKLLNLIEYKKQGLTTDAFVVRNGKVHIEPNRKVWSKAELDKIAGVILDGLRRDLDKLRGKSFLLDKNVHYGLPISRKQSIGSLPFGTTVCIDGNRISAGVYWHNDGGARDLDLSTIDNNGRRTGWGMYSGYARGDNAVTFSGDVTSAHDGAMEFMTSKVSDAGLMYGLFVNIFNGEIGAKMQLVVGENTGDRWISNPVLREEHSLTSRGNVLGFVKGGKFVVYTCRLNDDRWSINGKSKAIVARGLADFWTVNDLFDALGIKYDLDRAPNKVYDHDLTYTSFSADKLEAVFSN